MNSMFEGCSPLPWHLGEDTVVDNHGKFVMHVDLSNEQDSANAALVVNASRILNSLQNWRHYFDAKQLEEIGFDLSYTGFGTDGHNIRLLVAKFAKTLDAWAEGRLR